MAPIEVEAVGVQAGAAAALEEASHDAQLIVMGHRGPNPLMAVLLGSTAFSVVSHAACPVAVIRQSPRPLPSMDNPVVVGVDGSQWGAHALDEAAWLAADTGSYLRVVAAWQPPERSLWASVFGSNAGAADAAASVQAGTQSAGDVYPSAWGSGGDARLYAQVTQDLAKGAAATAQWAAEQARARYPHLKIEQRVAESDAADAILGAAGDASLIVMGARGHSDLKSMALGSVCRKVMQRAECAVYIVR